MIRSLIPCACNRCAGEPWTRRPCPHRPLVAADQRVRHLAFSRAPATRLAGSPHRPPDAPCSRSECARPCASNSPPGRWRCPPPVPTAAARRHQRRVQQRARLDQPAGGVQLPGHLGEQALAQAPVRQRGPKAADRRVVGHRVLQAQPDEAPERQPVPQAASISGSEAYHCCSNTFTISSGGSWAAPRGRRRCSSQCGTAARYGPPAAQPRPAVPYLSMHGPSPPKSRRPHGGRTAQFAKVSRARTFARRGVF